MSADRADRPQRELATAPPPTVEPMHREDLDAVTGIDRRSFPSPWARQSFINDLHNPAARYIVVRRQGEVVGFAGMWLIGEEAHISTLAVHPDHRGQGHGKRLLLRLLELARDAGAERVTLEVREANWVARRLYERFGFRPVAFLKSYYADTGENGVVIWLKPVPADRSGLPALADGLPDPANSALETDPA